METKIGIVEDEIIIADGIRYVLKSMQYTVPEPCCDYAEAIAMLQHERPDLVLLDVNLAGSEQDGIAVAQHIRAHLDIPFIFLTAYSDAGTIARAKTVTPNAFLVKPFQKEDLFAAIEIALHNFYSADNAAQRKNKKQYIFIKDSVRFQRVDFDEILYLESDHVYVTVHTTTKKYLVRTSLQQYLEQLDGRQFLRIHRGYAVNLNKIKAVGPADVLVENRTLPVSKKYKDILMKQL